MKKLLIWVIALLLLILLVFKGLPVLVNLYLNENADRIVSNMITRTSGFGDHEITFGEIKLDYNYSGTYLQLEDIQITPADNISENQLKVTLSAKQVRVSGFRWKDFLMENSIVVDSATIDNITIKTLSPALDSMHFSESKPNRKAHRDYKIISVKHFGLNHLSVENRDSYSDSLRLELFDLSVGASGFRLTEEYIQNKEALFDVDMIQGTISKANLHFDEYRQMVIVDSLAFNTEDNTLGIGNFSLIHKLDRYTYTGLQDKRMSWIEIGDTKLKVRGMDFNSYFRNGTVEIDSLIASNLKLSVFTDKRKSEDLSKRPPMFHESLNKLEQVLHIKNTLLRNGYLRIEERADNNAPQSGALFFTELNAHIKNISNHKEMMAGNSQLVMNVKAKLMDIGPVDLSMDYDLASENGTFKLKGTLGKMPLRTLNNMIEPEAKISLKSGVINRLDFNIIANDYEGSGEAIVRYEDLELELLNKDFGKDQNVFRKIGSFLANKVVIKSNNPNKRGDLKKGTVYYLREPHKSIYNYWWKLIFSGLKSTLTGEDLEEMKKKELENRNGTPKKAK
ncbi:hypothetical protein [Rhodonellum sp.]|uniref:hypothetical protein n=1 Tax=Rhodonellum sp. TaxID=2231180 RepID=UPI002719D544|nr:hypothetical protein [Rhodonellum sp.]MDO9552600.1 hypothetical protein [Rhodonellum sp.]